MYKKILCCLATVLVTQAATIPSAVVDDAEARLEDLRQVASVGLNQAFVNYTILAKAVDATALDTKANNPSDTVAQCVNTGANNSIDIIYQASLTLASTFIRRVYEEEKGIVFCGQSDEACLNAVIEDINKNVASIPDEINAMVIADTDTLNQQLAAIEACADQKAEVKQRLVVSHSFDKIRTRLVGNIHT